MDAAEKAMAARGSAVRTPAEDVTRSLLLVGGILEARKDFQAAQRLLASRGHAVSTGQLLQYFYGCFHGSQARPLCTHCPSLPSGPLCPASLSPIVSL